MQQHQLFGVTLSAACLSSCWIIAQHVLASTVQRGDCCPTAGPGAGPGPGPGTQRKDDTMVSSLQKRLNESQASVDSCRSSESGMVPWDSPAGLDTQGQSDNDSLGPAKRVPGPGSVQSDMTDEGSASRTSARPAAGWKGRMSSMLLRGPLNSPKSETIKALKVSTSGRVGLWTCECCFTFCGLWVLPSFLLWGSINLCALQGTSAALQSAAAARHCLHV